MNAELTAKVIYRFSAATTVLVIVWLFLSLLLPAAELSLFSLVGNLYAGTAFASFAGIFACAAVVVYCVAAYFAATATYIATQVSSLVVWGIGGASFLVFGPLLASTVLNAMRTVAGLS